MKALEGISVSSIYTRATDRSYVLRGAVGHPRTALWRGGAEGIAFAEEAGAKVTQSEAPARGDRFDLVFLVGPERESDVSARVAEAAMNLGEGAHLVLDHGAGVRPEVALLAFERADLEPLWRDGLGPLATTILVGRKRPERRKLSLTVGMISMNEEGAVGGVIDSIRARRPDAEILLVDSSKDQTPAIAERKGARVIRQFPPRGYGPAMTRLLYAATTDVIVTMDCDGTYPADRIDEFHARIEDGADLVNGTRTHRRPEAMPLPNYVANRAFAAIAGVVHGVTTTDLHSGMRAYRTSMLRGIHVPAPGAALPVELLIIPSVHGYRVDEVEIGYLERVGASTLQRWDSTLWTFRRILRSALNGGTSVEDVAGSPFVDRRRRNR
jgi:hypothetical protein